MNVLIDVQSFLQELTDLCKNYGIDSIGCKDDKVMFKTQWDDIRFSNYFDGLFSSISVSHHEGLYNPFKTEKEINND